MLCLLRKLCVSFVAKLTEKWFFDQLRQHELFAHLCISWSYNFTLKRQAVPSAEWRRLGLTPLGPQRWRQAVPASSSLLCQLRIVSTSSDEVNQKIIFEYFNCALTKLTLFINKHEYEVDTFCVAWRSWHVSSKNTNKCVNFVFVFFD